MQEASSIKHVFTFSKSFLDKHAAHGKAPRHLRKQNPKKKKKMIG